MREGGRMKKWQERGSKVHALLISPAAYAFIYVSSFVITTKIKCYN